MPVQPCTHPVLKLESGEIVCRLCGAVPEIDGGVGLDSEDYPGLPEICEAQARRWDGRREHDEGPVAHQRWER